MNNKRVRTKAMAMAVAAAMAVELCPVTAFAVTGEQVAADGTYTSTAQVNRTAQDDEDENGWDPYGISVSLTVKDGKFEDITVTPDSSYSEKDNKSYFEKAYSKSKGIKTKLEGQPATEDTIKNWDAVSTATRTSTAVKQAALEAMQSASEKQDPTPVEVNTAALQTSITTAEGKNQADYTEASWAALTEKLTAAKAALEAKESQEAVDAAQTALDAAVAALEAKPSEPETPDVTTGTYVLMNIPYDQFYAADVNNSVKVDAFTSATKNKVRTAGLAGGSYHVNASGDEITGVTFPVKVGEGVDLSKYTKVTDESSVDITVTNRGQTSTTTYTGKDALFESASYSYYTLSEAPSYYKEVTLNADGNLSFGKTQGTVNTVSGVTPELTTQSSYGDYQLDLDGLENTISQSGTQVYGVIVSTKEGNDYGMRHLENIWRVTELAWCTGFTSVVHNCPTSSEHYKSMMGQHINKVTYYTSKGIYEVPVADLYVPKKAGQTVKVADAKVSAGEAELTVSNLPTDFSPEYKIAGLDFTVENGKIVFKNAKKGKYTLTVSDKNNNYADMTTTFILSVDSAPASYNNDNENPAITKNADASDEEFADYINNITSVSVNGKSYAASGRRAVKVINEDGSLKTDATPFAEGDTFEIAVTSTGYPEVKFTYTKNAQEEYKYVYAAMTWAEYWAAEGVQAAGDSSSSSELDTRNEADKGAFDAVTRATANHGLHRGSFQCVDVIEAENGKTYEVSHWSADGKEITLTNGKVIKFNRGEITDTDGTVTKLKVHEVTGLKYVPVKVASADYEAFCRKYHVVENGGELAGGYGENKLQAYSGLKANVTEATNGLKTATKNADGSFRFSARQKGTESGIADQILKIAPSAEAAGLTVKEAKGSYGEFLRVYLTGDYGDLGANMQAVTWTYYGNDSTYSNAKATYGTKFAADNWMHKTHGIQLGLTKSLRCTLPEGTDGTGYWTITISALGYQDVTYQFQATDENIVKEKEEEVTTDELKRAIEKAEALTESDYTADSWASMQTELQEAKDELKAPKTQATVDEAVSHLNAAIEALVKVQKETYVLMNIPYDQFYKADVNNDVKVDAFTSATKNKVKTGSLAGGSYHVDNTGDEITGVTFPVKVPAGTDLSKYTQVTDDSKVEITVTNRGQTSTTEYNGKDALFESASYSYYTLSEEPSYYKELTVNADGSFSFGATQGTATTITEGVTADLMTESRYGDYQLDLDGLTDTIPTGTAIYGVIVSTTEGSDYGMRHLENIWRVTELAWSTGFTTAVHNCPTSSEHYKAMMGQHINKVTYYTANGIYKIPVGGDEGLYVPVKFDTSAVAVADAELKDGETSVATTISGLTLPEGFDAEYTVDGATAIVKGEKLILKDVKKGAYTLTITDKSGKYAPISVGFEVYAETIPASYNENTEKPGLTKAAGSTDAEFADYIKNITSVSVNGKSYAASGRGAVKLFNDDGTLITDAAPFAEGDSFEIVVTATGYKDLSFTYKKASSDAPTQEVNTSSLEKAIQSAETLKEADYTADSWKVLQVALKNAKSALEAKKDQTSVDNAAASLNKAMEALVKADGSAATPTPTTTPTTTPAASKNNTTTSGTGNKTTTSSGSTSTSKTAKTGDPTNIFEMLGLAVASLGAGGFALKRRKRNKK
jgi:LPXTG-motif cell wall-anchored protein